MREQKRNCKMQNILPIGYFKNLEKLTDYHKHSHMCTIGNGADFSEYNSMLAGYIKCQEYLAEIICRKGYGDIAVSVNYFHTAESQQKILNNKPRKC